MNVCRRFRSVVSSLWRSGRSSGKAQSCIVIALLAMFSPVAWAQYNVIGEDFTLRVAASSPTLAERMRVTQAGLVGIGISPSVELEVSGTISATHFVGDGSGITGLAGGDRITSGTSSLIMASSGIMTQTAESNSFLYISGAGANAIQLGQGRTDNNYAYIDLVGDATYTDYGLRLIRNSNGPNAGSLLNHRGTGSLTLRTEDAAPIVFMTANTDRMRVTSAGNVGIGMTTPSYTLDVSGTVRATAFIGAGDNLGNHTATQALSMAGNTIGFSGVTDKVYWYSNTYGTGMESSTLTNWSASAFRWRIGGTTVSAGSQQMLLNTTGLTVSGSVLINSDDSVALPGYSWSSDTNTGMYWVGADQIGISAGGTQRGLFNSSGLTVTGAVNATNVRVPDGDTAALPGFAWQTDTNTGMYHPTTDVIGFSIGGTERMRVHSNGYVGISNTSPAYPLDITGGLRASGEIISTNPNQFRMVQGNYGAFWRNDGGNLWLLLTNSGDQYGSWNSLRPMYVNLASGALTLGTSVIAIGNQIEIQGGNPHLKLTDTTASSANFWNYVDNNSYYVLVDRDLDGTWETPHPLQLNASSNVATVFGQTLWNAGNDGSGSGLDADTLDGLNSTSFLRREIGSWQSSSEGQARYYFSNGARTYFKAGNNGDGIAATFRDSNDVDRVHISHGGDIYSGALGVWLSGWFNQSVKTDASPTHNNLYLSSLGGWITDRLGQDVRAGASPYFAAISTNGTGLLDVHGGIRTRRGISAWGSYVNYFSINWTGSAAQLYIDTNNVGTISLSSDRRLKKGITTLTDQTGGLSKIMQLNPVSFHWKGKDDDKALQFGLIAQEVAPIFPNLVHNTGMKSEDTPDGTLKVEYQGLVAPMIKAIQELKTENDKLRVDVSKLQAVNDNVLTEMRDLRRELRAMKQQPKERP